MELILKGMGVSVGKIRGRVCLIQGHGDYSKLKEGDILVTHLTDPSMTIIINKCAGIICDVGGMTSHPAIIARELGIPAVVHTQQATTTLSDGMEITMDGTTGEILK